MPAPDTLITALDIGSSKISALIAERGEDGSLSVLGTGQRESKGVTRGYIADMAATEKAIREAVEQAERIAGTGVETVWVGFSAGGLSSATAQFEVDLGGHRVEQGDIDALLEEGRRAINPDVHVLHAQPTLYTLDGLNGVKNPLGLHADRLAVEIHVLSSDASPVRNLDTCVRLAHLEPRPVIAAPVATGIACLSDEERELGVALVELGAGVTNVSLFIGGVLVGLKSIAIGGSDITDDIASKFGVRRHHAERMKCFHGSAMTSPRDNHEMIDVAPGEDHGGGEPHRIRKAELIAEIRHRLDELTNRIEEALKAQGFPRGRQIVLTGGGAELKGIADYLQGALGRAVRVGRPRGLAGLPEAHAGPAFATLAGLVRYGAGEATDIRDIAAGSQTVHRAVGGGLVGRLLNAFKAGY